MGFPGGFIGGFALTASVLYLTAAIHRRNREAQSLSLSQQSLLLRQQIEPLQSTPSRLPLRIQAPEEDQIPRSRMSIEEAAKDKWNTEVTRFATWAQEKDWQATGRGIAEGAANLFNKARSKLEEVKETAEATKREGGS